MSWERVLSRVLAEMVGPRNVVVSGTVRDGNGNPECISFPTANSRPLPTSVSVPTDYRPDLRHYVPAWTVSRPVVLCIPDFSRPVVLFIPDFSRPVVLCIPDFSRALARIEPLKSATRCEMEVRLELVMRLILTSTAQHCCQAEKRGHAQIGASDVARRQMAKRHSVRSVAAAGTKTQRSASHEHRSQGTKL